MTAKRAATVAGILCLVVALEGCITLQPINYRPRYANYSELAGRSLCPAAIGTTSVANPALNSLGMRGADFAPVEGSFAAFVGSALEEELAHANLHNAAATQVIDIALTENKIDPSMGNGYGRMAATFTVRPLSGAAVFSTSLSSQRQWSSAFYGMTAVEQARIAHVELVADLIHQLFTDAAFTNSLRCAST